VVVSAPWGARSIICLQVEGGANIGESSSCFLKSFENVRIGAHAGIEGEQLLLGIIPE
jgi:hypothetical protein